VDDEIFGLIVLATGEVGVEDGLSAGSVSLGRISKEPKLRMKGNHTFWASIEVPDI
jgi:hypothetical protein